MKLFLTITTALILFSCYGVNEKNSYIAIISSCCNSDTMWPEIYEKYKIKDVENPLIKEIISDFERQPFSSTIIYFEEGPEEYIGIGGEGSLVRYVYNKNIRPYVLDGLSTELSDSEKVRITSRINAILFNYFNEDSRHEAIILLNIQCDEYLEKNKEKN